MTVYVDDMLLEATVRNGDHLVRGRWSHLMADTTTELHTCAAALGLQPAWLQKPNTPMEHYDITAAKRAAAIRLGAVPITSREGAHLVQCKRRGIPFALDLLRSDAAAFQQLQDAAVGSPAQLRRRPGSPARIQLSRAPGWYLPPGAVSVAHPTRWANPYPPQFRTPEANALALEHFHGYLARNPGLAVAAREELAGKDLACWCRPSLSCHADVWLEVANSSAPQVNGPGGSSATPTAGSDQSSK